jgi:MPBQ/MSBQ methyltransferase
MAQNNGLYDAARKYIQESYTGIYPDPIAYSEQHFKKYIELEAANPQLDYVVAATGLRAGYHLLDMGCGFGSFVLASMERGIQAVGIDTDEIKLEFARARTNMTPAQAEAIYQYGDALNVKFPDATFDVITAWNLLEHVPKVSDLIAEAYRLLKPGGYFIGVAPNYLAVRQEAHYKVPWLPLLPKRIGAAYLRALGRNPNFLIESVFYVTNPGVRKSLKAKGFKLLVPELVRINGQELIRSKRAKAVLRLIKRYRLLGLVTTYFRLSSKFPFRKGINFLAQKE